MYNNMREWIGLLMIDPMDIVCEMVHSTFPIWKQPPLAHPIKTSRGVGEEEALFLHRCHCRLMMLLFLCCSCLTEEEKEEEGGCRTHATARSSAPRDSARRTMPNCQWCVPPVSSSRQCMVDYYNHILLCKGEACRG